MAAARHVALIMDIYKPYDRKVIAGIARYVRAVGRWSLYVEDEPLDKIPSLRQWRGDGIIANFDDLKVAKALAGLSVPMVGVGGGSVGYDPQGHIPYVATNNASIARLAADHLLERGFRNFGYCGMPKAPVKPWSEERGEAFAAHVTGLGYSCSTFRGKPGTVRQWETLQKALTEWITGLERPLGLMCCNDTRAHHVLEACRRAALRVPEDVAVIGVDNDEMMCELAIPPLSSVIQGTDQLGYETAALLDRMMETGSKRLVVPARHRIVIEPVGIATRQSTDILAVSDPAVAEALRFIRGKVGDRLQVTDVARHVHLSRSTLDSRFRIALRRTAADEIQRLRLARAQELLRSTPMPLKQIASTVGYSTVQYMTAVFRRRVGQTPGQYARQVRR
jgi:LacI family transcriptional regulator